VYCKHASGKKRKTRIAEKVKKLLLSQDNAADSHKTLHQIQEAGIPKTSVYRIEAAVL